MLRLSIQLLDQINNINIGNNKELDKLQLSQEGSPPTFHLQDAAQIVGVHEHMDKRIGNNQNAIVTSRIRHEEESNNSCYTAVVIDVKECHLTERFSQHEEECVNVLPILLHIINIDELELISPQFAYMSKPLGVVGVKINRLTSE